ncbi:hypothetical protein OG746_08390 [Streptomyces sp. NBC_01016]|uniref:hypothetical protein n=1 Tax=Streptomyces sp. NBC_01016 TaxID=2903720 RepID=UPI00225A8486|nr:hypothetical protein [Streptomyces sp. NBC_01016]MCX4828742.1 hypothetical protein [Streptomyces sp. NBC_01016]
MVNGEPRLNLEIAHIRAFEEGGKRFDSEWSISERNGFANLILLCHPHHKEIDGTKSDQYPIDVLESWKREREADGLSALAGLGDLTEHRLGEMISEAQTSLVDRIEPALEEFGKFAPELAALLKVTLKELADPRVHGFGLSEDEVNALSRSSDGLSHLQDTAFLLSEAAQKLTHLQDTASLLSDAAQKVTHLPDSANTLADAADGLVGLSDDASTLARAAARADRAAGKLMDSLEGLPDNARILEAAADKAARAADEMGGRYYR